MAVAIDAATPSHTGTTSSTSQTFFDTLHTPVAASVQGVLIFVMGDGAPEDIISSVTYGGVDVPAVGGGFAADTALEVGFCKAFHLGADIPSGPQTVRVNRANNATSVFAGIITLTASTPQTSYAGVFTQGGDTIPSGINIDDGSPGGDSLRFMGAHFGFGGIASTTDIAAGSSRLLYLDYGSTGAVVVRENTAGPGSRPVGAVKGNPDDWAAVYLAITEYDPPAGGGGKVRVKSNGIWREATPHVKTAGVWRSSTAYARFGGVWRPLL